MIKPILARGIFYLLLVSCTFIFVHAQEEDMEVQEDDAALTNTEVTEANTEVTDERTEEPGNTPSGSPQPAIYLPLKPAFVVNYGGKGHLRYLKTELAVRLASSDVANSVRHHMPWIRNNLVMLFARQTEESINSQEGREQLRQDALAEIRKVILEEDGAEGVVDVYFNTFIVQN